MSVSCPRSVRNVVSASKPTRTERRSLTRSCLRVYLSAGLTSNRTLSSGALPFSPVARENFSRPALVNRKVYNGEAAQRSVPGSTLVFTGEHGQDARTYRVSFKKILTVLKDYYRPQWGLDKGGQELVELFKRVNFTEEMFRGRQTNRLKQINYLLEQNRLDKSLKWNQGGN